MTITLEDLKNNLNTIESCAREENIKGLIPDYYGVKVFSPNSIIGNCWRTIYVVRNLLGYNNEERFPLFDVMNKTYYAFNSFSEKATQYYEEYKKFFLCQVNDEQIDINEVKLARNYLVKWLEATNPFINLIENNKEVAKEIQNIFYSLQCFRNEKKKNLDTCAYLIQLEFFLTGDIPVKSFLSLINIEKKINLDLASEVEQKIEMWIEKVNALGNAIDVRLFYRALSTLMKCINESDNLGILITALKKRGCKVLDEVDTRHVLKYHYLKKFDDIELEEVISSKDSRYFICTIKNKEQIFITGSSQADLACLFLKDWWGISPPKVIECDPEYRWAILEKLKDPIINHKWISEKSSLSNEDRELAMKVCNHIYKHINDNTHPEGIQLKHLRVNSKGELATTTRYSKGNGFHFMEWECLCDEWAGSNPWVFLYLMKVSQLDNHLIAKYFRDIVITTLKDQNSNCLKIIEIPKEIRKKDIYIYAKALSTTVLSLFNICQGRLVGKNQQLNENIEDLKNQISTRMIFYYNESGAASIFPKNLVDKVIETFDDKELKAITLPIDYYDEEFIEMKRRENVSKSKIV